MNKILFFSGCILFLTFNYNIFSKQDKNIIRNDIKNQASENTKTANDFLARYNYDKALIYFNDALNKNISVDNIPGIIKSNTDIGRVYLLKRDYNTALIFFNNALKIANDEELYSKEQHLKEEKAYVYNGLGEAYYFLKNYKNSEKYFNKALKIHESLKDYENQGIIYLNLAKIDRAEGKYDSALKKLTNAANKFESAKNNKTLENPKNLSLTYYSLGQTYSKLNNYQKAIENIEHALIFDRLIENSSGIADDYYALGILTEKLNKDTKEILRYYNKSKEIYNILNNISQYIEISNKIAEIHYKNENFGEFYKIKTKIFKLSTGEEKKHIAEEIIKMLNHENINNHFTNEEIFLIKKEYINETY